MPDPIPPFSLSRQNQHLAAELSAAVQRVLESGRYTQGSECEALEAELAAALYGDPERVHCLACGSGTGALHLALRAAGVRSGDTVLTTGFSFFATAGAILLAGAQPEFIDIEPGSLNLDPQRIAEALQRPRKGRLGAILPVHLFGRMADMPAITALAQSAGVPVIEDAAQAIGAKLEADQGTAGACGAAGCFSFYPTKNLGAAGEGGLVTTRDEALAERVRLLRVHGSRRRYEHELAGWNDRMQEMQAAVLRVKLPYLEGWNRRRRTLAALYQERLRELEPDLRLPAITPGRVFHQFVVRSRRRDGLRAQLASLGVGTEVYYPSPLHHQPALRAFAPQGGLPEAERAALEVLALPLFPELTDGEAHRVCDAVLAVHRKRATA